MSDFSPDLLAPHVGTPTPTGAFDGTITTILTGNVPKDQRDRAVIGQ
jgi:hypothetical protein